jgi:hypothetical protein
MTTGGSSLPCFAVGAMKILVRFEVFTAVTMKKAVFWDVAPCRSGVSASQKERKGTE